MRNRYRDWVSLAERLRARAAVGQAELHDVPIDMLVDIHDSLARLWLWQQRALANAERGQAISPGRTMADLATSMPRLAAICSDLEVWGVESATRVAVPGGAGMVTLAKPPQQLPHVLWPGEDGGPAQDGGLIIATAVQEGDELVIQGDALALPRNVRVDQRLLNALDVAEEQWKLLAERQQQIPQTPAAVITAPQALLDGQPVSWKVWLRSVLAAPPAGILAVLGSYPDDPKLQQLWRRSALLLGTYRARYGVNAPTDNTGYVRSLAVDDGGASDRRHVWDSINGLRRARRELGGIDGLGAA